MQTVLLDEKLREKKYGISSQPISPQQTDWLIVYGPLTSCNNKKIRKIYNIVPGHLTFLMLVSNAITLQMNVLIRLDEF